MGRKSKKNQQKNSKNNSNQNSKQNSKQNLEVEDDNEHLAPASDGYPVTTLPAESSSHQSSIDHSTSKKVKDALPIPSQVTKESANPSTSNVAPTSLLSSAVAKSAQSTPLSTPARTANNTVQSTSAAPAQKSVKKTGDPSSTQKSRVPGPIPVHAPASTSSGGSSQGTSHSVSKSKDIPISGTSASRKLFDSPDRGHLSSSPSSHSIKRQQQLGMMTAGRSISRSPADALLSKSIPKAIPRRTSNASPTHLKVATPSSVFMNAAMGASLASGARGTGSGFESDGNDHVILDPQEVSDIIAEHLVQPSDIANSSRGISVPGTIALSNSGAAQSSSATQEQSFGSMSHSLKGGSITRDIYKWQEDREQQAFRPRSNSNPELFSNAQILNSPSLPSVSALREPGGFRRHFISNKAKREGKPPPNFLTANFIDFLILYGYYGGDVYPSDDDEEGDDKDSVGDEESYVGRSGRLRGPTLDTFSSNDEGESSERTPLLRARPVSQGGHHGDEAGTSQAKAFFMLVKAFVGTGVLFLPKAFSNGGLVFSIVSMIIIGYLTKHCMILLVEASRAFGGKSFGDLGHLIYGEWCKHLVLASIAISQMGFCCAYFIFVAQNLRDLLLIASGCAGWAQALPDWIFILVQLLLYVPLAWVRKIKNFGITSLIADVFILAGLGYIFCYDLFQIGSYGAYEVPWVNLQSFPLFIGTAMFAFEGICLMLPIAESMKEPAKFSQVLDYGMLFIGLVFLTIGALGYLAFGPTVETIVFLNLPKRVEVTFIQFFYAVAIMLSFPLCVYPAIRITEQALFGLSTGKRSHLVKWQKNLYRAALTSTLGLVAWAGASNLDKVVSLVGCFACIPLSFIYPALFHSNITTSKWVRWKDWGIVVFGTVAMFYTTYITVEQWAKSGAEPPLDRCKGH